MANGGIKQLTSGLAGYDWKSAVVVNGGGLRSLRRRAAGMRHATALILFECGVQRSYWLAGNVQQDFSRPNFNLFERRTMNCFACGESLHDEVHFCGQCGAKQGHDRPAATTRERSTAVAGEGMPPTVASSTDPTAEWGTSPSAGVPKVDPECKSALNVYQADIARAGIKERDVAFSYFHITQRELRNAAAAATNSAMVSALTHVPNTMETLGRYISKKRPAGHGDYDPSAARYFLRYSTWIERPMFPVCQMTYIRSGSRYLGGWAKTPRFESFPPSPLTNLFIAALPFRSQGEFVCNREYGGFVANPHKPFNPSLTHRLNSGCAPAILGLLDRDFDGIEGRWLRRVEYLVTAAQIQHRSVPRIPGGGRDAGMMVGRGYPEPNFVPTLFDTEVANIAEWGNRLISLDETPWRLRHLAAVISPFRNITFIIINYPVPSLFDRLGHLLEVRLALDELGMLLSELHQVLAEPENHVSDLPKELLTEDHTYWSVAGNLRSTPRAKGMAAGMMRRYAQLWNQDMDQRHNWPVPPFEFILNKVAASHNDS